MEKREYRETILEKLVIRKNSNNGELDQIISILFSSKFS